MSDHVDHASGILVPNATPQADGSGNGARIQSSRGLGRGEVDPEPSAVALVRRGNHVVAVPKQARPALKAATVEKTTAAIRDSRIARTVYSDHQRLEARSLALHSAIALKIARNPDLLGIAKRNLERWRARISGPTPGWLNEWNEILRKPRAEIAEFLVSYSEDAIRLRQSSPFAGVLTPAERKRIYDAFRS